MNKFDLKLIIVLFIVSITALIIIKTLPSNNSKAQVFYDNKLVLEIILDDTYQEYTINGYNGDIVLIKENKRIKVKEEISPLHLCSKQGFISKSYETIVCLPNKVVVKIVDNEKIDTVVR